MSRVSQTVNEYPLTKRILRKTALAHVASLYALLPGPKVELQFDKGPPVIDLNSSNHHSYRRTALKNNFLKKFKGFTAQEPRKRAKEKFLYYEKRCDESNQKIKLLRRGHYDPFLQAVISTAQRKIALVLGKFDLEELLKSSRWGPGSTSSCKDPKVDSAAKFSSRPDVTREFLWGARLLMPLLPSWSALLSDADYGALVNPMMPVIEGNKVTFVPKTALVDRVIAIEPHVNAFFQAGLGRMIRKKMLKYAGIDLNDQSLNQTLARYGSIHGDLATIDLEGASDLICLELVRELLPEDWFFWLNATRSHKGTLDGETFTYNKFSSMGNGATFDLESLIFWALSSAAVEIQELDDLRLNVFGDDIIVPSKAYDSVVKALEGVGFLVNKTKSYSEGPFRESCGMDWFEGFNVRSLYLKDIPVTEIDWIILANGIRKLAHTWCESSGCCSSLKAAYDYCLARISKEAKRYRVPLGYELKRSRTGGYEGNGLLSNWDEASPSIIGRAKDGWEGWMVRAVSSKAETYYLDTRRLVTAGVHTLGKTGNEPTLRGRSNYREVTMYIPEWYDMGPWK